MPTTSLSGVYALGNFDGLHRGHQAVLRTAIEKARALNTFPAGMTFEPHPRRLFKPEQPHFRLTPASVKHNLLLNYGMQQVHVIPFTPDFAARTAEQFARETLFEEYRVRHIVTGSDFVFGKDRGGNAALLRSWLEPFGIGVTAVEPVLDPGGERYAATRIRECLQQGDARAAAAMLGRAWSIMGEVVHHDGRGGSMGFPTANISLGDYLRPKRGVYAVMACKEDCTYRFPGVANIGVRPTVDGTTELLEFHLFDFSDDLYGQTWWVELIDFLRPEEKFPSLAALKAQISKDCGTARQALQQPLRLA
ncbi:MAG: bifunctional riboflavin kinase/FAD synthetase [Alphaproteobacteria bacterium]|nr:bifunctional riboflavin kinase/FAD synthetase [Alphaproteobacteria bacterium]